MHTPVFKKGVDMATSVDQVRIAETLDVGALAARTSSVLERLRDSARSARADERREPTFPIGKAAELVGRTAAAIREAEKDGRLPPPPRTENNRRRSEEHTSELQSLMRISCAVICLKKKNKKIAKIKLDHRIVIDTTENNYS